MTQLRIVRSLADFNAVNGLQLCTLGDDVPMDPRTGWWWLLLNDRGDEVAFAGMVRSTKWADTLYLCRSGVLEEHRGNGFQKRLIRARTNYARRLGYRWLISDTGPSNLPSANSLAACGFRLYEPASPFGLRGALYWRKRINP